MWLPPQSVAQDEPSFETLGQTYQPNIQPLLKSYCHECHSGNEAEAEIDLAAVATMADVRRQPKLWLKVRRMLDSGQMPPKDEKQPTDDERNQLQTWVRAYLTTEAQARAGDPGPLVLRRLNNAEYNYTVRDLTGVPSLDPTREFPVDGAAGEGFTNTGAAQGMSPALVTKYVDAAKEVAAHAVLTPDGIRFSPYITQRDQTDELLVRIQAFYRDYTEDGGGSAVDLQGIKFDTNQGGRLPLARYLAATLAERQALTNGTKTIEAVAKERNLSAKYLGTLWKTLSAGVAEDGTMLGGLRARWRATESGDPSKLVAEIEKAQKDMWKFNSIGQIGREGGPPRWMEAIGTRTVIVSRQEFKLKLPEAPAGKDVAFYLAAGDAGDGNDADYVLWKNFRLEGGGRPALPLRDVAGLQQRIDEQRREMLGHTGNYLVAASAMAANSDVTQVAAAHNVDAEMLKVWLDYLAIGLGSAVKVEGHFTQKVLKAGNNEFINGWGSEATPILLTNRSDQPVSFLTLTIPPHAVTVHPSPTQESVVAWQSPVDGRVRIEGRVADADDKCGNGAAWRVELSSYAGSAVLASGAIDSGRDQPFQPEAALDVRKGDVVSLVINARDRDHICDTTHVELKISQVEGEKRVWDLASDVVDHVLKGNPLPDSYGHAETWHFCATDAKPHATLQPKAAIAPGSVLALWLAEKDAGKRIELARRVQALATGPTPADAKSPDALLQHQLQSLSVPVDLASLLKDLKPGQRFGRHPLGHAVDSADLVVRAPEVVEFRIPAELAAGRELVGTAEMDAKHGHDGTAQVQVLTAKPDAPSVWPNVPILVCEDSPARDRIEGPVNRFCNLFPPALCYARIVPVDEVVTLTLFHREDDHLKRLMLDDRQAAQLDRLWDELFFVSQEPLKLVVAFEQISEFATQDRPDLVKAFAPMRKPINDRADAFRKRLVEIEPAHVNAVLEFADGAWRRPLTESEQQALRGLYQQLRDSEMPHEEAIRLALARVLTSPSFLYRKEQPAPGDKSAPISNLELANRLSYFLWSSLPDEELRRVAGAGQLTDEKTLVAQARRMLDDDRTRRLAIQFACQWLHIRDFDQNDDKNENLFPEFATLRGEMYEESVRFFEDMFRHDGSILGFLNADHTFLNEALAKTYGIGGVSGPAWRRVDGVREKGRGGVLGMATVLASQSGASRTSPILRGNWVYETLLGERLPRPPAGVPQLPDAVPAGLTARQLIEHHTSVATCAKCHTKIDPYGFALEQYDAIGRLRPQPVDTKTKLPSGREIEGIQGLRDYLAKDRHDDVVGQFCRKLLGYSLGREVQLSDEPLLADMQRKLAANDYRFSVAVEMIVTSRQFREIRGRQAAED